AAALDGHLAATILAVFGSCLAFDFFAAGFGRKVASVITLRVARAAEEEAVAADALEEFALAALLTLLPRGNAGLVGLHLPLGLLEVELKALVESLDRFLPGQLAFLDLVELLLHARGEADIEDVLEALYEQIADLFAEHGGREPALVFADVFAIDNRRNNRSGGGRAAASLLVQLLPQTSFPVRRGRPTAQILGTRFP